MLPKSCRVGFSKVEITPSDAFGLAGYASLGKYATSVAPKTEARLFATALALRSEDNNNNNNNNTVIIVALDLHSTSKFIWEEACILIAKEIFVAKSNVIFSATHTHTGPGQYYGNFLYDRMTTPDIFTGFRKERATLFAQKIASAAIGAFNNALSGFFTVGCGNLWGASSQRALAAFENNEDEVKNWCKKGYPGFGGASLKHKEDKFIDPRVRMFLGCDHRGNLKGFLSSFSCHSTSLGNGVDYYAPDWAGKAKETALKILMEDEKDVVCGFMNSACGDISPLPLTKVGSENGTGVLRNRIKRDDRPTVQGVELRDVVGGKIGEEAGRVAKKCVESVVEGNGKLKKNNSKKRKKVEEADFDPLTIATAHEIWEVVQDEQVGSALFGLPTLGGAPCGPNDALYPKWGAGWPSNTLDKENPQHPKTPIPILSHAVMAVAPKKLPLHFILLNNHAIVTVPGEPTTCAAFRIETAVIKEVKGVESCSVLGFSGEYCGYWVTKEEYDEQLYEGSSMLFGRNASDMLTKKLVQLGQSISIGNININKNQHNTTKGGGGRKGEQKKSK